MSSKDYKSVEELMIYCNSVEAGLLKRTKSGCEFQFSQKFIDENKNLSFHIKNKAAAIKYRGDNLPPFFAGLLPEGLRLKAVVSRIKTSEDDLFSILAAVGNKCVGDIYARNPQVEVKDEPIINFEKADFYSLFEESLESTDVNSKDESFAGVQEKISASMINFPLRMAKKNKFYILKLNPKDKPLLVENEKVTLELAAKCGLKVNSCQVVKDKNNNSGLLVERFDRIIDKEKKLIMLHQEDACQFLNRYPSDKYRVSFQEVCKGVAKYATAPKIEILKLMELYLFSYLVGNGDLHAKNISLQVLKPSQKVVLTPFYDLLTTYIYKDHKMAIKMNGRDDNIKRSDFTKFGESFALPEKSVNSMVEKLIEIIKKNHELMHSFMDEKQKNKWQSMFEKRLKDLT